ncbi:hypothetical protein AB0L40_27420 [Patulibacter sp. NPDC049589]|uniref:acyl-CoA-like ligand-binding transcription factor n=1 Tax=Patulibacter sp. NPDC049589 TaxID=3154731 RepID=UPI003433D99B
MALAVAGVVGGSPEDMGPQIFAGATMAFFWKLGSLALEDDPQDAGALLKEGFALLHATLAAVTAPRA